MAKNIPGNSGHGIKNNKYCAKQYICCFGELRELAVILARSPIMLFGYGLAHLHLGKLWLILGEFTFWFSPITYFVPTMDHYCGS